MFNSSSYLEGILSFYTVGFVSLRLGLPKCDRVSLELALFAATFDGLLEAHPVLSLHWLAQFPIRCMFA